MRKCKNCGVPLRGRIDKIFCTRYCRADYHNKQKRMKNAENQKVKSSSQEEKNGGYQPATEATEGAINEGRAELLELFMMQQTISQALTLHHYREQDLAKLPFDQQAKVVRIKKALPAKYLATVLSHVNADIDKKCEEIVSLKKTVTDGKN